MQQNLFAPVQIPDENLIKNRISLLKTVRDSDTNMVIKNRATILIAQLEEMLIIIQMGEYMLPPTIYN
jgi:hypothetical protein